MRNLHGCHILKDTTERKRYFARKLIKAWPDSLVTLNLIRWQDQSYNYNKA